MPHAEQRYETVGDYWIDRDGEWTIVVSDLGDWRMNVLVALHEFVELALTQERGIPEAAITAFDVAFEAARAPGNEDEPGHDPRAPYHREHVFAERLERQFCEQLGIDWNVYDQRVMDL